MNEQHELRNFTEAIMSSFGVVRVARVARVAIGGGGVTIIASGGFGVRVVVGICGPARKSHLACDLADRDRRTAGL